VKTYERNKNNCGMGFLFMVHWWNNISMTGLSNKNISSKID
jgi:hypothetical protein